MAAVISFLSHFVTLEPGDVIATGTPSGVGSATGTFLKPGDLVRATIAPIGMLENPVEAETEIDSDAEWKAGFGPSFHPPHSMTGFAS